MPQMLGDIVVQLLGTLPDVDFIGRVEVDDDALDAALRNDADILIVRETDGALRSVFAQSGLSVLQISPDGQDGVLVRFAQQHVALDRGCIDRIAALVRDGVAGHA